MLGQCWVMVVSNESKMAGVLHEFFLLETRRLPSYFLGTQLSPSVLAEDGPAVGQVLVQGL